MSSGLKTARNAAASAMAWTLYHAPVLEGPYAHAARAARDMPQDVEREEWVPADAA